MRNRIPSELIAELEGFSPDFASQDAAAAEVRALVTEDLLHEGNAFESATVEAIYLLRHLRADRAPEAEFAHRALCAQITGDLHSSGNADPALLELINRLHHYLDTCRRKWFDGQWGTLTEYAAAAEGGAR